MATTVEEKLIQGIRAWVYTSTDLDRKKVIPKDEPGPRPALPYIVVSFLVLDEQFGQDELEQSTAAEGNPQVVSRGYRRATVSLNGYGKGSADLIMKAALRLTNPAILDLLCEHNFSVRPISGMPDISELASNEIEKRFAKDFELQYLLRDTDPEAQIEATTFVIDMTYDPGDLLDTLTITC